MRAQILNWKPKPSETDLRGWEWYYLFAFANQSEFVSNLQKGSVWKVDFNPDDSQLVEAINGWGIQIRDVGSGTVLRKRETGSVVTVDWSSDGSKIVSSDFRGVASVWDASSLELLQSFPAEFDHPAFANWSPDSKKILRWNEKSPLLKIVDVNSKKTVQQFNQDGKYVIKRALWSPDGKRLAAIQSDYKIKVWNIENGEKIATFDGFGPIAITLCWSPDGTKLASGGAVHVWDVGSGKRMADLEQVNAHSVAWRPGRNELVCGFSYGLIKLMNIDTGSVIREYWGHTGSVRSLVWNAQGSQFASCSLDRTVSCLGR